MIVDILQRLMYHQGIMKTPLAVSVAILSILYFLTPASGADFQLRGQPSPDFFLKDLGGESVSLGSLRGKVVVLSFWATWCPSCKEDMPLLNTLASEYAERGLVILGLAEDSSETRVKDYISANPATFRILLDKDAKASRQFRAYSIPMIFLLDRGGNVVERYFGLSGKSLESLKNNLEELTK